MAKPPVHIHAQAKDLEAKNPKSMVAIFSTTGEYLYASESHLPLMGITSAELVGKNLIRDVLSPEDIPHTQLAFMDAVLHGKSVTVGVNLKSKSGDVFHVRAEAWHVTDPQTGEAYLLGLATPTEAPTQSGKSA